MKMEEPEKNQDALKAMREVRTTAEQNGHSLREYWVWDNRGHWRTSCNNRNCYATAWVATNGESGGRINGECWMKTFNKNLGRETD